MNLPKTCSRDDGAVVLVGWDCVVVVVGVAVPAAVVRVVLKPGVAAVVTLLPVSEYWAAAASKMDRLVSAVSGSWSKSRVSPPVRKLVPVAENAGAPPLRSRREARAAVRLLGSAGGVYRFDSVDQLLIGRPRASGE